MVNNEPTTPSKDFSWLGTPAPAPAPMSAPAPDPAPTTAPAPTAPPPPALVTQVKTEMEDDDDDFDRFPIGAVRFTRAEIFARMEARRSSQIVIAMAQNQEPAPDSFDEFRADIRHASTPLRQMDREVSPTDFSGIVVAPVQEAVTEPDVAQGDKVAPAPEAPESTAAPDAPAPVTPAAPEAPTAPPTQDSPSAVAQEVPAAPETPVTLPAQAAPPPVAPEEPTLERAMMSTIEQLMKAKGPVELNIRRTDQGITMVVKTPEKGAPEGSTTENQVSDSQMSTASSVLVVPRRRLRVLVDSEDEEEQEEEELMETEPEDDSDEENDGTDVTPKKRSKTPSTLVTPSPAKRLRTLDLNLRQSSEESEDDDDSQAIDDSMADPSPFDSYRDPEYVPDSQELRDRPSDFRIPRTAAPDPLDLDY